MKEKLEELYNQVGPWLLTHGVKILLIAIGAWVLHKIACKFITKAVRLAVTPDGTASRVAEKQREDTLIQIFNAALSITIFVVAGLMILTEIGIKIGPVLAAAGIVGLAFGFGGQYLIRDVITGLFIILENQYRIGDVISLDNTSGLVEKISLRMTTLRDLDGTVHHVPNGEIKKVSNLSKNFSRVNLNIGIAYNSDIEKVIEIVDKTGQELADDPQWKDSIIIAPKFLRVDDMADSAVIIKILGDTLPLKQWEVAGELRKRILIAFSKAGIEIPFPQMVLHKANAN